MMMIMIRYRLQLRYPHPGSRRKAVNSARTTLSAAKRAARRHRLVFRLLVNDQ